MSAPPFIPPVEVVGLQTSLSEITEAINEIQHRLEGYQWAMEFDSVDLWAANTYSREGSMLRQIDDEFTPNFVSCVLDAINNRIEVSSIVADNDALTALLADAWEGNELDELWGQWQRDCLRDGDKYIVVWPSEFVDEDEQIETGDLVDVEDTVAAPQSVNVTDCDPRESWMAYRSENPRVKRYFANMWEDKFAGEEDFRTRLNLYFPDRIEKYVTAPGRRQLKPTDFKPYVAMTDGSKANALDNGEFDDKGMPVEWPMVNPYGQIPVFHLRTWRPYGKPVARAAWAPQDLISKISEAEAVTTQFMSYPQRYLLQDALSQGTQTINEDPLADESFANQEPTFGEGGNSLNTIPEDVSISNETGSQFEASPRTIMMLKGFKSVGTFTPSDPQSFIAPKEMAIKSISATTGIPMHLLQGLGGGQLPSGESLRVSEAPLVHMCKKLSTSFGRTLRQINEFTLLLYGYHDAKVIVSWADPATSDLAEVWSLVNEKVEAGVPRAEALMQAGVPADKAVLWAAQFDASEAAKAAAALQTQLAQAQEVQQEEKE